MPRRLRLASTAIATALTAVVAAAAYAGGPAAPSGRAAVSGATGEPATTHLVIRHVQRGCHVWSTGSLRTTSLRLDVAAGARLHIVNRDIVPHRLVQLAGPELALQGHMMVGKSQLVTLGRTGIYRFKDTVVEMGPMPTAETNGRVNTLRLTVTVR
jgi:hypothetical protein